MIAISAVVWGAVGFLKSQDKCLRERAATGDEVDDKPLCGHG
jgi:hypothetical protein